MKRLFAILLCACLALNLSAQQQKDDVILKANGDELKGKITEVTDNEIKFTYSGETAVYSIKKSDIQKITFSSGRVETFSQQQQSPASTHDPVVPVKTVTAAEARNKVAVLPFTFIRQGQSADEAMSYKAQEDAYNYLSKHGGLYTYIDPRTTNALLIKAGINKSNIMGYTMSELCNKLGVEFVVTGAVNQTKEASTSSSYSSGTVKDGSKNNNKTVSGYSSSSSYDYYGTTVSIDIFNNQDAKVYSSNHRAILNSTDASYDSPLQYVLKRSPFYQK